MSRNDLIFFGMILAFVLALRCTPAKASEPVTYYAAGHVGTEILLKANANWADEYEISTYNRVLTTFVVGVLGYAASRAADDKDLAAASCGLGIVTGNFLQLEW